MAGFFRALGVACVVGVLSILVLKAIGAPEGWYLGVAVVAIVAGSLADREGFYGEPHPFARRRR